MKDHCVGLRRQILEDVLGDNVEEYENFNKKTLNENRRQHRQRIPLWQFLLHLLNRDEHSHYIEWSRDRALEFRIKDTLAVAALWGSVKNKTDMTYEKLGRAMRYYYGKNIIEKVSGRRYTYRFILSRRTKKYLAQFVNLSKVKEVHIDAECTDDSASDSVVPDSRPGTPENETTPSPTEKASPVISDVIKVEAVKPTLHQNFTKTKIFKPNEIMEKNFQSALKFTGPIMNQNREWRKEDSDRRSAFSAPSRSDTKIYQSMPLLEKISTYGGEQEEGMINENAPRKRKHTNDNCLCSCGVTSCSTSYEENNEEIKSDSESYWYWSMPPQELTTKSTVTDTKGYTPKHSRIDDFILRKDARRDMIEKKQRTFLDLQQKLKLNRTVDPFMGYDYFRLEKEYERHESYYDTMRYDTLDDYVYEGNHRRHAWVA